MRFRDRADAGAKLAQELVGGGGLVTPIVLGIPRGGVPVAAKVARELRAELGVIVARKIGAPRNPELGIGATTASGATFIDARLAAHVGANDEYVRATAEREAAEARRRERAFDGRRRPPLAGRSVIIVDDGIATGATMIAAIRAARAEGARRVIAAAPVSCPQALEVVTAEADEVVCLVDDPDFMAVGAYYDDFEQVEDDAVRAILDAAVTAP